MKTLWLLSAALLAASPARAIQAHQHEREELEEGKAGLEDEQAAEPEPPSGHVPPCAGETCPQTLVDTVLYSYGTACTGLDWRFLRAVATAESGLDPKNHTGKYVGLFQMDKEGCGDNLGVYKSFLSCDDLEDPEVNTAVAADRFDRYFRGRGSYPSILKACPGNTPAESMALAYVGHNNGPAVLKHALKRGACKDAAIRKAIASFYESHPGARDDGKFLNKDGALVDCKPEYREKYGVVGTKSWRCVNAKWGIAKYEYGRRRVASVRDVARLYAPGVTGRTLECPSVAGKRLFSKQKIVASIGNGSFKDKPIADPEVTRRLAERRRESARRGAAAYAKAEKEAAGWSAEGEGLLLIAGKGSKGSGGSADADRPGNQLPVRFTQASAPPPDPPRRWASEDDDELERAAATAKASAWKPKKGGHSNLWSAIKSLFGF